MISRDWICQNVWKIPDLPKPKVQDYDPTKGRRDIRFFPESESELLAFTEEEMEIELDYVDEDKVLSVSPVKSVQGEMSVVQSPRRSPRFMKPQPLQQEILVKESQIAQGKKDSAATCSLVRDLPREALEVPRRSPRVTLKEKGQAKACSLATKTSMEGDVLSGVDRKDTQARTTRSVGPKVIPETKRRSRSGITERKKACSSTSSVVEEHSEERRVQILQRDNQQPASKLKRGASGHTEELVISTTFLKRTRTDDIIHQVR